MRQSMGNWLGDRYERTAPAPFVGGQSKVWPCVRKCDGLPVVVKTFEQPKFFDRETAIVRQVRALEDDAIQLRNVVEFIEEGYWSREDACYNRRSVVIERATTTLREVLDKCDGHRLPAEEAVELCLALARILSPIQDHSILHQDLKPGNVLLYLLSGPAPPGCEAV